MATKNMEHWNERFNLLKEYVEENHQFPSGRVVYKDIKLGDWLKNQRASFKRDELPLDCVLQLNKLFPFWCSSKEEIAEGNKNFLINSDWKSKIPEGNTPIDTMFKDDKLYEFKKQFAKNTKFDFYVGKKIWNKEIYDILCKLKKTNENEEYFPAYRKVVE